MSIDPRMSPENLAAEKVESATPGAATPPADVTHGEGEDALEPSPESVVPPVSEDGEATGDMVGDVDGAAAHAVDVDAADADAVGPAVAALTEKAAKAEEYLALAQRTKADFENYRRRAIREAALAQERGVAKLAKELLPAVDNLDRALSAAQTAADAAGEGDELHAQLLSGIQLVHADVISALQRAGIEAFSPEGETFDPQWHEAVAQAPIPDAQSGSVVEVYQRGYRLGESVLRPARVLVAA